MAQRQETQLLGTRLDGQFPQACLHGREDVLVAQHRAFGGARGAGCVDQKCHILRRALPDLGFKATGSRFFFVLAQGVQLGQEHVAIPFKGVQAFLFEDDHLFHTGRAVWNLKEFIQLLLVLDDEKATGAVFENIGHLRRGIGGVNPRGNAAHALNAHIKIEPFLAVF